MSLEERRWSYQHVTYFKQTSLYISCLFLCLGGGDKKIPTQKLSFSENATSKCGSLENADHVPGGGDKKVKLKFILDAGQGTLQDAPSAILV